MDDPRFRFVRADIADAEAVDRLFEEEKPDIVVNFAAESHVDRSITDPCVFVRTNVMGTQVLMESCRRHGVKLFHQVSTDEVYGDLPLDRPDLFFTEETPLHLSLIHIYAVDGGVGRLNHQKRIAAFVMPHGKVVGRARRGPDVALLGGVVAG